MVQVAVLGRSVSRRTHRRGLSVVVHRNILSQSGHWVRREDRRRGSVAAYVSVPLNTLSPLYTYSKGIRSNYGVCIQLVVMCVCVQVCLCMCLTAFVCHREKERE